MRTVLVTGAALVLISVAIPPWHFQQIHTPALREFAGYRLFWSPPEVLYPHNGDVWVAALDAPRLVLEWVALAALTLIAALGKFPGIKFPRVPEFNRPGWAGAFVELCRTIGLLVVCSGVLWLFILALSWLQDQWHHR